MNVFILHNSPAVSAFNFWALDTYKKHRRPKKMLVEACQLLSNALYELGLPHPYKPTHLHHPCSIWTRQHGYKWVYNYAVIMNDLYELTTGKKHNGWKKCKSYFQNDLLLRYYKTPKEFVNCTNHKDLPVIKAYKKHLEYKIRTENAIT